MDKGFNLAIERLFISGPHKIAFVKLKYTKVSISQSRCFSFQGFQFQSTSRRVCGLSFNLAIEMLFISGPRHALQRQRRTNVSISQSRCFSFQAKRNGNCGNGAGSGFNLAIEMLFISGRRIRIPVGGRWRSFNLAIEMLFISGPLPIRRWRVAPFQFQSRNRDAFHFR